jgi:hypothetical protein
LKLSWTPTAAFRAGPSSRPFSARLVQGGALWALEGQPGVLDDVFVTAIHRPAVHTVLRPVMFMENHADETYGRTGDHALIRMIPSNATVQLIAVADIGAFAALAFGNPDYYGAYRSHPALVPTGRRRCPSPVGRRRYAWWCEPPA